MQGLKYRILSAKEKVKLRVRNGARVSALAVRTHLISLPTEFILELKNCYFVLVVTKKIISISTFDLNGFTIIQKNKYYSFSRDGILYVIGSLFSGLYILDLDKSILNIGNKKLKFDILKQSCI